MFVGVVVIVGVGVGVFVGVAETVGVGVGHTSVHGLLPPAIVMPVYGYDGSRHTNVSVDAVVDITSLPQQSVYLIVVEFVNPD